MVCLSVLMGTGLAGCTRGMKSASLPPSPTVRPSRAAQVEQANGIAPQSGSMVQQAGGSNVVTTTPSSGTLPDRVASSEPNKLRLAGSNPWKPAVNERRWKHIVMHHTASAAGSVASIDRAHRQRKDSNGQPWLGIGYHFVIGNGNGMKDGEIQPTFRWNKQIHGAHAGVKKYNELGIGIVLIGNFEKTRPTKAQLASAKRLVKTMRASYGISAKNVLAHQDINKTACPGRYFSLARITGVSDEATLGSLSPDDFPLNPADRREVR